jgi:hypothetical protein
VTYLFKYSELKGTNFFSVRKLIAISLSLILLLSSMGFSAVTHYCGGHAVKSGLTLVGAVLNCGMQESSTETKECGQQGMHYSPKRCCNDQRQVLQTDDNYPTDVTSLVPGNICGLIPHGDIFLAQILRTQCKFQNTTFYPPPPLSIRDVQVLFQTFLI